MEKIIRSEIVFACPVFKAEHAQVELPDGTVEDRWYAVKNDAVGIVALNSDGKILLTREYRSASQELHWRIPAGGLKDGELPEEGARRELREETGYDAEEFELLIERKFPSGWVKQTSHFFLAKNLYNSPLESNEFEDIEIVPSSLTEVKDRLNSGEMKGNIAEALRIALGRLEG